MQKINYNFILSVSTRCFADKEQAKSSCGSIKFVPREIDQDTFLSLAGSGYAFTYIFKGNRRKPELFLNTSVIIYDFDHCDQPMEEYIAGLMYPPTMGYTTYSNGRDGEFSFRLVYCLDTKVEDEDTFNAIYSAIAVSNGFGKEFDRRRLNQLYFGSNRELPGYGQYNSHLVYSMRTFGVSPESIVFPKEYDMDGIGDCWEATPSFGNNHFETDETLNDQERLEFYDNYVRSLSTPLELSASGTHYCYPEAYYAIPIRIITWCGKAIIKRWRNGEHRRKKLYIAALIMLKNVPDLTRENLRFNLWQLIKDCIDNNEDPITTWDVDGIVERAMANRDTYHLAPTRHGQFKLNKEYWKDKDITDLEAVKAVRKEINMEKMEHYDWTLSVAANQREMERNGYKLSRSTIYRYVKEMGIPKRDIDGEILELILQEPAITIKEISSVLGISTSTINRHIRDMREAEMPRVRRIKRHWVVEDYEQTEIYGLDV